MKQGPKKSGTDLWNKKSHLSQYKKNCRKDLNEVRKQLKRVDSMTHSEALHDLRIHLKRLLALQHLLSKFRSESHAGPFKPYAKLFELAGRLRQSQVEYAIISPLYTDTTGSTAYLHELLWEKKEIQGTLNKFINKKLLSKIDLAEKRIKDALSHLSSERFERYIHKEQDHIREMMRKDIYREHRLHEVRKRMKDLYLIVKAAGSNPAEEWTNLLNLLGEWHDLQSAFDHVIRAIYSGMHSEYDLMPMHELKLSLLSKKGKALENVQGQFRLLKGYPKMTREVRASPEATCVA